MIPYRHDLREKATILRNNMTSAERHLWWDFLALRDERWSRQKPLLDYIVDFYCHPRALVIEIDGESHMSPESEKYDALRTQHLNELGLTVLRFTNDQVFGEFESVCRTITEWKTQKTP